MKAGEGEGLIRRSVEDAVAERGRERERDRQKRAM